MAPTNENQRPEERPGGRVTATPFPRRALLTGAGRIAVGVASVGPMAAILSACSKSSSGGGASASGAPSEPLKIGLLTPVTGPLAPEGEALKRGFEMGLDAVNSAGGVFGKDITFVIEDDQGTASVATTMAKKLIQQENVDVVFGTVAGDTTIAVMQLATQAKVPFMKTLLDDYLNSPLCSDYFFKLGESDYQLLKPLIPYMVQNVGTSVALVGSDFSFPHAYNDTAKTMLADAGAQVVTEQYAPLGTTEWSSVIGKVKSAQPDFILSSVVGGDAIAFMKESDSLGLLNDIDLTGISLNQEFYPGAPEVMDGRTTTVRYTDQIDNDANKAFVGEYRSRYNDPTPIAVVTANSFVGMHMLAEAVNTAGTNDPTEILSALRAVTFSDTVYGSDTISFDPNNQVLNTNIDIVKIESGGKYTIVDTAGVTPDPTKC